MPGGSELVSVGPAGHINVAAGFGNWPQGIELLKRLDQ
ncbi:alpha/beta hydrolase [Ohtaekwangia sp.]